MVRVRVMLADARRVLHDRVPRTALRLGGAAGLVVVLLWVAASHGFSVTPAGRHVPETVDVARPHAVILKSRRTLYLFEGNRLLASYPVALGSNPVGQKSRAADGRTPVGVFRVCTMSSNSPYHRFIGLSYPDLPAAERGLRDGLITYGEYAGIRRALSENRPPSWHTALGGGIGLHGGGTNGDWTAGCIALNNGHIEELFDVLRVGDRVEILP